MKVYLRSFFTLLELLVAIFLSSLIILVVYLSLTHFLRFNQYVENTKDEILLEKNLIRLIERDFNGCVIPYDNNNFFILRTDIHDNARLSFITTLVVKSEKQQNVFKEVSYYVEDNKLIRRIQKSFDKNIENGGENEVLLSGINKFKVEVYTNGQWVKEYSSLKTKKFPSFIKINMKFQDKTQVFPQEFSTILIIPVALEFRK